MKVKLTDICRPKQWKTLSLSDLGNGRFPVYGANGRISFYTEYNHKEPVLLVGCRGSCGSIWITDPFSYTNGNAMALDDLNPSVDIKWLGYYLKYRGFNDVITGTSQPQITQQGLQQIVFDLPDITHQKKIAQILDRADALSQKRKQSLQLLDDFLRATFLDMFGDPLQNGKRFKTVELKDLCSHVVDCPHSTPKYIDSAEGYTCIRSSDLQNGFLDFSTTKFIDQEQYMERIKRCKPLAGDIIYCREGARFGAAGYVFQGVDVCLGQRTMLFRADPERATPECLWGIIVSDGISHQASQLVGGAASPHVNVKDIKKYKAFCPPLEAQKKYSQIFKHTMNVMQRARQGLVEMDNQFNALTQRYFG